MQTFSRLLGAVVLSCTAVMANAATVTMDFDGTHTVPTYIEDGFEASGLQMSSWQNGNCFAGSCIQDANNGQVAEIHRVGGGPFKLVSFYFYLNGLGSGGTDFFNTVCAKNCLNVYDTSAAATLLASLEARLAPPSGVTVRRLDNTVDPQIIKNIQYIATFDTPVDILSSLSFYTFENANLRIDSVVLQTPDPVTGVPVPATGLLGLAGLASLFGLRRRRHLA